MTLTITHAKRERFNYKNALCHIITRCNNKEPLIHKELDFAKYKYILKACKGQHGFLLYNYVIMNSHVHLIIKLTETENISKIMHSINRWYARWYNEHYGRKGHFWEDRFYAEPINEDDQFLAVMRYLDLNPVRAGLCKTPADWRHSGARVYLSGEKDELIDIPDIYINFGETNELRQKAYASIFPTDLTRLE